MVLLVCCWLRHRQRQRAEAQARRDAEARAEYNRRTPLRTYGQPTQADDDSGSTLVESRNSFDLLTNAVHARGEAAQRDRGVHARQHETTRPASTPPRQEQFAVEPVLPQLPPLPRVTSRVDDEQEGTAEPRNQQPDSK